MERKRYLTIEGNIGTGKTSLAKMIAKEFNFSVVLEAFAENTFLPQFYNNPEQFAFPLEMSFMAARYKQLKEFFAKNTLHFPVVTDYMFTKSLLFAKSNLKKEEYALFDQFFQMLQHDLPKPQLIVFLHKEVPALQKNIFKRGRSYEMGMQSEYLEKINKAYSGFIKKNKSKTNILYIPTDELDFVNQKTDFQKIVEKINMAGFLLA
jgi:deoxyadenosine/deoxycytidine kinase